MIEMPGDGPGSNADCGRPKLPFESSIKTSAGWEIYVAFGSSHVIPADDDIAHIISWDCGCHPQADENGIAIHNSADGREAFERGERKRC